MDERAREIELLIQAQAGDADAFADLYASLAPALGRFVRRLIGAVPEADDVVQDALTAFYFRMATIAPPEMLRAYVFRIARNRCYDILRRQGRYREVSLDADEDEALTVRLAFDLATPQEVQDALADALLMHLEVRAAMERLPEMQRQTLMLFADEALSYDEIAAVTQVSVGTVKSRLFHARKNVRGLLRPAALQMIDEFIQE